MSQQSITNPPSQPPNICALTPIIQLFPGFPNFPPLRAHQRPTQVQTQTQTQIQYPPSRTYRLPSFSSSSSSSSPPSTTVRPPILPLPLQARPRPIYHPQPQPQLFPPQQQQPSNLHTFTLSPPHQHQYIKLPPLTTAVTKPARRAVKSSPSVASATGSDSRSVPRSADWNEESATQGKGAKGRGKGGTVAARENAKAGLVLLEPKVRTSAEMALGFASATWDRREGWLCRAGAPNGGKGEAEGVIKKESVDR